MAAQNRPELFFSPVGVIYDVKAHPLEFPPA
jgi:hypothetical protein